LFDKIRISSYYTMLDSLEDCGQRRSELFRCSWLITFDSNRSENKYEQENIPDRYHGSDARVGF